MFITMITIIISLQWCHIYVPPQTLSESRLQPPPYPQLVPDKVPFYRVEESSPAPRDPAP
jgi:hypothetical protein